MFHMTCSLLQTAVSGDPAAELSVPVWGLSGVFSKEALSGGFPWGCFYGSLDRLSDVRQKQGHTNILT